MKMRFNYLLYTAVSAMLAFQSCDKGFEEMNINPDASSNPNPEFVFSKTLLDIWGNSYFNTNTLFAGGSMQHFSTWKSVPAIGDKYFFNGGAYPYDYFNVAYPGAVNEIATVLTALDSSDATTVNKRAIARIMRVYIFHKLTDLYGDIPYSEAGKGYTNNLFSPKYDEQSAIYPDMLKELDQAAAALTPGAATFGKGDYIYNGDAGKWKKFAYSLMLRLGMRLTKKSDQTLAQTWVTKAIAGGVIMDDADIATMKYTGATDNDRNPAASAMLGGDYGASDKGKANIEGGKYSKTFIDYLKATRDPRLNVIAVSWSSATAFDTSTAVQQGMPNGLLDEPVGFRQLSQPHPNTVLSLTAPLIVMSAAETKLLLAEAAVRGWYAGNAATLYSEAIGSSMRNWALFGNAGIIASSRISEYQAEHPLTGTTEQMIAQISTQKWVSLFLDETEIHANWRRTGYPVLTPVNVSGNVTNGEIPRRLLYTPSEESLNAKNLADAIQKQGANTFTTHVWWDKP
jgi:hypothetical protein